MTRHLPRGTRVRLATALALTLPAPAAAQATVEAFTAAPPLDRALWGVSVTDAAGRPLAAHNAARLFLPASTTKLVVTAVAAARLPADWTVATSVHATGPVRRGRVRGDLVLYGRGDPTFSRRCYAVDTTAAGACDADPALRLRALAGQLKARGIRRVDGGIVGDGTWFEPGMVHPTWETYDLNWWYAAPVGGLAFNDNSVDLTWRPGAAVGDAVAVELGQPWAVDGLDVAAVTALPGTPSTLDFFRPAGTMRVQATGAAPADARGSVEHFALPDPALYAARAFRAVLADSGITVLGTLRSAPDSGATAAARATPALAEVASRPLRDWLFPILNTSQNLFAEMLLKQLGRQFGTGGSWSEGLAVTRRFLIDSMGIDSTQFRFVDGSGLSGSNFVSPLALTRLLAFMRAHPSWPTFAAGLPLAGQRGSLRRRFAGTPLEGLVRAKTGSIGGVNTLAGYVELPDRTLVFAVAANHHTLGSGMIPWIDSLVVRLAADQGR